MTYAKYNARRWLRVSLLLAEHCISHKTFAMEPAAKKSNINNYIPLALTETMGGRSFWWILLRQNNGTYLLTYLLTYSVVQSLSWEANWFAASQEIPCILWNPKVHYRTHKRPPPVPILGQPNLVHIPTFHLLEIHPNIIHPSTPTSPQWSLYLRFPHQDPIRPPPLTHTRHMPSPSHSSRFYLPHNIGWGVQAI